jgi:hypothetical protein
LNLLQTLIDAADSKDLEHLHPEKLLRIREAREMQQPVIPRHCIVTIRAAWS